MAHNGRISRLTPELQAEIVRRVAAGNYPAVAAVSAGISASTFYAWMARGKKERSGPFRDFLRAVRKAESDAEVQNIAIIRQVMKGGAVTERKTITRKDGSTETVEKFARADWAAAMTHAERRWPDRWGKKESEELAKLRAQMNELINEHARIREMVRVARTTHDAAATS
jgi:transposase